MFYIPKMLSGFLNRQIYQISNKPAKFSKTTSAFQEVLGVFGSQTQIRRAFTDTNKNSSKEKDCDAAKEYRPTLNDPYRLKRPYLELKPILESNAKAALDCRIGDRRNPCTKRSKDKPPKPPPVPSKPIPWQRFFLLFAFIFGTSGLLYQAYERKMKSFFLINSTSNWTPRKFVKKPQKVYQLPKNTQYLIIGAGTAGVAAYKAISENDKKAMIMFISDEDINPYAKPPLSKGLWTNPELNPDKLSFMVGRKEQSSYYFDSSKFMEPKDFSELKEGPAVTIAMGWPIIRVDADNHKAYASSNLGEASIEYKKCLIATGSRAVDLRFLESMAEDVTSRICRLRTVRDLETALVKVCEARDVVIVGDGSLALELAYSLKHASEHLEIDEDMTVTLVIPGTGILSKVIPDYLGQWAAEMVKIEDIILMKQSEVLDCYATAEKNLTMYLSNGQEIPADYIFLAMGAVPRTDIAKDSFLELDKERGGFLVNTELMARTDLYVAGDCASLYDIHNDRIRFEHYNSACDTGCLAGYNMAGGMKPFSLPPSYTVKFGKNILMQSFGETHSKFDTVGVFTTCTVDKTQDVDKRPPQPQGEEPCFKRTDDYKKRFQKGVVFYLRQNMVIGLVLWNLEGKDKIATEILSNKPKYEDIQDLVKQLKIHEENCCGDC